MAYWWVNQGQNYNSEHDGGYILAGIEDKSGAQPCHWRSVLDIGADDVIFHYAWGKVQAVGTAKRPGYEGPAPDDGRAVYLADVEYQPLVPAVSLAFIPLGLRLEENRRQSQRPDACLTFGTDGKLLQRYLTPLSNEFGEALLKQLGSRLD